MERLSTIYSDNLDLKLYLLSISLRIDSKERTKSILEDIKKSPKLSNELRLKIQSIDEALLKQNKRSKKDDWVRYIDIGTNFFQENIFTALNPMASLKIRTLKKYLINLNPK